MSGGQLRRPFLENGTLLAAPFRFLFSCTAGWMSVMGDPGVCDEKVRSRNHATGVEVTDEASGWRRFLKHVYLCSTHICARTMKANITLKLDAALLREIRILAAEEGTSISAMLAARLEQIVRERKSYDRSRRRALARLREGLNLGWIPPRSRDELYQRWAHELWWISTLRRRSGDARTNVWHR